MDLVEGSLKTTPTVRLTHTQRNCAEQQMPLGEFIEQYAEYLAGPGQMIDQPGHSPVRQGMVRCYLTHNQVVGFGHQYVTALLDEPVEPKPRLYYPETKPEFQALKTTMETEWLPQLQALLNIAWPSLPIIWDADFLNGPKTPSGEDTYVLCEINVSSVYPYPESAPPYLELFALCGIPCGSTPFQWRLKYFPPRFYVKMRVWTGKFGRWPEIDPSISSDAPTAMRQGRTGLSKTRRSSRRDLRGHFGCLICKPMEQF